MSEQRIDQPSKAYADACCGPSPLTLSSQVTLFPERDGLIREAFRLEWLTIGWMTIEAALISGLTAGSLVLTAFGLDSVIELASAAVLMSRLAVELRQGRRFSESVERAASRAAGALLFALLRRDVPRAAAGRAVLRFGHCRDGSVA